jgi:hypothetical protein
MNYLSEVFSLSLSEPNLMGFRLTPDVDKKTANSLSWRFSRKFPYLVVIWYEQYFWALGSVSRKLPSSEEWRIALQEIQEETPDLKHFYWSFQWLSNPTPTAEILAELAVQILKVDQPFAWELVLERQGIQVREGIKFWAETLEVNGEKKAALALTPKSDISYRGNLAEFFENHPYRQDAESLLVGLKVQDIETNSSASIVGLAGTVGEHRHDLIKNATGSISKSSIISAPSEQPLVSVKFSANGGIYSYAMAALKPLLTAETAGKFEVDYGQFLKATKLSYSQRQKLLTNARKSADSLLSIYGFTMAQKCINSRENPELFWLLEPSLEKTKLLFGKGYQIEQSKIITGLTQGKLYRVHPDCLGKRIRISALKLIDGRLNPFLQDLEARLKSYDFQTIVVEQRAVKLDGKNTATQRVEVEKALGELLATPTDIVLVFLPESDRHDDETEAGSYYDKLYSMILYRRIASQFIYEDTLKKVEQKNILNQITHGILAKLGNLPYVLAEPLSIADYIIGLDVSRRTKKDLAGTTNACASIRLYGARGEFISYRLESEFIAGETIPLKFLEKVLPEKTFGGKTTLIYRDGRFAGREVEHLVTRAQAIGAKFILVECRKSQIPRLYNYDTKLDAPSEGLALKISPREAILVTTQVKEKIGVARPLRLNIHPQGEQVALEKLLETTLKLTLLHHGTLKKPRLPMPLHGADRMAELRLKGIYPSNFEGDRQFWL